MALTLATTPDSLAAQARPTTSVNRAAVVSSSHPRAQTTRAMGVPASVQPAGSPARRVRPFSARPFPGHPFYWPTGGFVAYPFFWPAVPAYPVIGSVELEHGAVWRPILFRHGSAGVSSTIAAARCVVVEVHGAEGVRRDRVALPALDADTPEALLAAVVERLEAGRQVPLVSLNGTRLIIPAGPGTTGVAVRPCHTETGARDRTGTREVRPW